MYDSRGIFRIYPNVHPPHPLYICQWIDCKYLFMRAHRGEEAWRLLVLLDLWYVPLWALFPARYLVVRDQLVQDSQAFLPFLEWLLIIPFVFVPF